MPTNGDATGQVPPISSPDGNGQVPPTSQASSTGDPSDDSTGQLSPEQLKSALDKARVDAKELADLRAFKQQQDDARLSESEKIQKQLATLQEQMAEKERMAQERVLRADIRSAARDLGLKPELAYRLLDLAAVEYSENGDPTNVAELLAAAVAEFGLATPAAAAPDAPAQQQPPISSTTAAPIPAMGATNPPRGSQVAGANGTFSRDEIPRLTDPRLWRRGS